MNTELPFCRLGIFSDPHYCLSDTLCRTRRPKLSLAKIAEAMESFRREKTDLCICLGDLTDVCENQKEADRCLAEVTELTASYGIPFYVIPGNHDYHSFTAESFSSATGSPIPPYFFDTKKYRFVALDANYRSNMVRYDIAGVNWKDSNIPPEQADFLKSTIAASDKPCVVLIHENLDPDVDKNHIVKNSADIRAILEASGKVKYVFQGHYHKGHDNTVNKIRYITVPAMCEGEENRFFIIDI